MDKFKKIVRFLIHVLRENLHKKKRFLYFYSLRDRYKNWMSLYFVHSSLFLDLLEIIKRELRISLFYNYLDKITFKVIHHDGTELYHSISTRSLSIILENQYRNYMEDFRELYGKDIELKKGEIVVDIGAHVGSFSIPMAKKHKVKVFAYEPDPNNVNCILKAISGNKIHTDTFMIKQCAVWSEEGVVEFSFGDTPTTGSVSQSQFFLRRAKNMTMKVKAVSLQSIFDRNNIHRCKILKIDCEGSEYAIFSTVPIDILNKIDYLFIEIHPTREHKAEELLSLLQEHFIVKYRKTRSKKGGLYNEMYEVFCRKE